MFSINYIWRACRLLLAAAALACGQASPSAVQWLTALQSLQSRLGADGPVSAQETEAVAAELRFLHREISLSRALDTGPVPEQAKAAELRSYVAQLRAELERQEREKPDGAFRLGRIGIDVSAPGLQAPVATVQDEPSWRDWNQTVLSSALESLPGVTIQRIGARNERAVSIRGFDVRQTPLYIDGIPVYVPYDGYVDLDRFVTSGVQEIQVAKGFTSPLYGPNAFGGAINIVSKEPQSRFGADAGQGFASGGVLDSWLNLGSRWQKGWLYGGFSRLSADTFPLPGSFRGAPAQPAGDRLNASSEDIDLRLRAAWTPAQDAQYVFSCYRLWGVKQQPPYAGDDPGVRVRYWRWPTWDKESFSFSGRGRVSSGGAWTARLFYDKFDNLLRSFDDARYSTQTRPSSFDSLYDDDAWGGIAQYSTRASRRHTLNGAFFYKDDTHRERNIGQPWRSFRDRSISVGVQDTLLLGERLSAVLGFSADRLSALNAEDFQGGRVLPFPRNSRAAFNGQAGLFYTLNSSMKARFTFARKTRLPTMKDRYSYRLGQAVPNPDLQAETAAHWEAGVSRLFGSAVLADVSLFWSEIGGLVQRYYLQPNLYQLRNLGNARHRGGEVSLRGSSWRRLIWDANYTYIDRQFLSGGGVVLVDVPRHSGSARVSYSPWHRLSLQASLQSESGRVFQNDAGRTGRVPGFAVAGLGALIRLHPRADLLAGVNNVGDRFYFVSEGYPEAGRTLYVKLRFRL
ncbi:MAG: TonB-dependent receptor plug domain-containing protein [Bryobacteraceae bacterium]